MLSLVTPDKRVPVDHPLRRIKVLADQALAALSPIFDASDMGMDEEGLDHSTLSRNRQRLLEPAQLMSDDHFTVDGRPDSKAKREHSSPHTWSPPATSFGWRDWLPPRPDTSRNAAVAIKRDNASEQSIGTGPAPAPRGAVRGRSSTAC
jgi:hypothetical protein